MSLDLTINGRDVDASEARRLLETTTVEDALPTPTATESTTTVGVLAEAGALREASQESGRALIRIIEAGQGSSGLYPEDTLREAAQQQVFAAGTPMFLDHPTASEGYERPERSVRDLAGRLTENARYEGGALVAEAEIFPHWREVIAGLAEHVGVSIRADGRIDESGTVREISRARSVDYVTEAGAGGRIEALVESARQTDLSEVTEAMADDVRMWLRVALQDRYSGDDRFVWVRDYDPDAGVVIFDLEGDFDDPGTYRLGYSRTETGVEIDSGAPTPVRVVTTYEPLDGGPPLRAGIPESTRPAPSGDGNPREEPTMSEAADAPEQTGATTEEPTEAPTTTTVEEAAHEQTVTALQERVNQLEREQSERDALDQVRTIVREATDLPDAARQRAVQAVDLTSDDLAEATKQAIGAERTYLAEVRRSLGVGRVTGMGEAQTTDTGPVTVEDYQKLGLSEADAKAAARIHA